MASSSGVDRAATPARSAGRAGPAPARRRRPERPERGRGDDREALLLVGPGDRVDDGDDDGEQGQGDHDRAGSQVAEARIAAFAAGTLMAM